MKDFFGLFLSNLESLFTEFNFRKLLYWIFLISVIISIGITFDSLTGFTFFMRMEKKVAILNSLNNLSIDEISTNPDLYPIYRDTISELKSYRIEPVSYKNFFYSIGSFFSSISIGFWKFISGGFLGFIVAIAGLVDRNKGGIKWTSTFFGGLIFGLIFGLIGIVIPTIWNIWINIIFFPVIQIAIVLFFSKRKK